MKGYIEADSKFWERQWAWIAHLDSSGHGLEIRDLAGQGRGADRYLFDFMQIVFYLGLW